MKKVLLIMLLLVAGTAYSQVKISALPDFEGDPTNGMIPMSIGSITFKIRPSQIGVWDMYIRNDSLFKKRFGSEAFVMAAGSAIFNGNRPVTRDFSSLEGVNLNTNDLAGTLNELLYPSQPPTSSLTVTVAGNTANTVVVEKTAAATIAATLNYSAGRQAYTENLQTIVVAGVSKAFTQPAPGASVSGTHAVTVTSNSDISYTNAVTTTDSKQAVSNATVRFQTKWYYGFIAASITNPSNADILGLSGSAFTTVRTKPLTTVSNSTDRKLVIAFDAALDPSNVSQIWIGGLNSTSAFTRTVQSFTNASGYTSNYIVYTQISSTSSPLSFEIK